jgi:hypothetical protein
MSRVGHRVPRLIAAGLLLAGEIATSRVTAAGEGAAPANVEVDCASPPAGRAPDPRCGEPLDGRARVEAPPAVSVARGAFWLPRMASRALFWPVLEGGELVESRHLPDWYTAILTSDDGKVGVRPVLHYSTGFLPTGGLRAFYRRFGETGAGVEGTFQTAGPSALIGELDLGGPTRSGLRARAVWNRRDDRLFAGIGPNSEADLAARGQGLARFGSDVLLGELRWSRPLLWRFVAGAHGDLQRRDYRAWGVRGGPSVAELYGTAPTCAAAPTNDCVDPMQVPGFASGLRVAHAGATLVWDGRSHDRDGGGLSVLLDATYADGLAGDPSRHLTTAGEVVAAVGGLDRVLLLRGRAAAVRKLGSAPIPFEELATAAGPVWMRGFADGRFRGESALVGTAEYRWYVAARLDASLFADIGTVAGPGFSGLRGDRWFPDVGVGLRVYDLDGAHWEGALHTGVQLAYAPDGGVRLLLSLAAF